MNEPTFRTKLNSILKDNAIERFVGNKKKGKVNTKRLYKIGDSRKIFKQKEERKGKDYSITLLLDASGSMKSSQSEVMSAVGHIGNALNKTDIPFSVYAFADCTRLIKTFEEKYDERRVRGHYYDMFDLEYYCCYNCNQFDIPKKVDKHGDLICPYCGSDSVHDRSNGGTNDALALHIVGTEVHKAYKKNIMIVVTDGAGDDLEGDEWSYGKVKFDTIKNNRTVINKLHKKYDGLILLAISIGGSYVRPVYGGQYSQDIKKPQEVFNAVAKLLSRHITRG